MSVAGKSGGVVLAIAASVAAPQIDRVMIQKVPGRSWKISGTFTPFQDGRAESL
jgi:hypothetical protein